MLKVEEPQRMEVEVQRMQEGLDSQVEDRSLEEGGMDVEEVGAVFLVVLAGDESLYLHR